MAADQGDEVPRTPSASQPAPPPAWPGPQQEWRNNWMGTVSLVLAITMAVLIVPVTLTGLGLLAIPAMFILGVIAFVFGLLGLVAARRGRATNWKTSLGGVVLSLPVVVLLVGVFLGMVSGSS